MLEAGFFPEKKYSQNFLIDESVVQKLVSEAKLSAKDHVLEIGGGTGVVTEAIADTKARVTTLELRPELAEYMQKRFAGRENVEVREQDVLQANLSAIPFTKVVASPPYAISDDIMYALFAHGFSRATLVWQLEFAEKICAPPGSGEYHPLSVIGQYAYTPSIVQKISPRAFYPIPNHFSAILSLEKRPRREEIPQFPLFVSFLRTLFRFRNKTLGNAAKQIEKNPVKGLDATHIGKVLREMELEGEKVFLMEPEEFVELFEHVLNN